MGLVRPSEDDLSRVARQWLVADSFAKEHLGEALDQSLDDLVRLQRLMDRDVIRRDQAYELQCLGIAFGRVLAHNIPGLDWWMVDDELGRDPTLRCGETSLQINVLTMLSKRVEAGQSADVRAMYEWVLQQVDALKSKVD